MDKCEGKRKNDLDSSGNNSDCVIVPFMANTNTMNESDSSSGDKERKKSRKKFKKEIVHSQPKAEESDSSVEIVDVKLLYERNVQELLDKPTQELDTLEMWDRLVEREMQKSDEEEYDAE